MRNHEHYPDLTATKAIANVMKGQRKKKMTSYEFEKVAKNAVIKLMKEKHDIDLTMSELEFVWFAHELGYKKCTLYAQKLGHYYPEVTYNRDANELYVDIYLKQSNTKISADEFDFEAHV